MTKNKLVQEQESFLYWKRVRDVHPEKLKQRRQESSSLDGAGNNFYVIKGQYMIEFGNIKLSYNPILECVLDKDNSKIAFLSKEYDEIHLVIEIVDNKVIFHPRFNVNIKIENSDEFYIDVNYSN